MYYRWRRKNTFYYSEKIFGLRQSWFFAGSRLPFFNQAVSSFVKYKRSFQRWNYERTISLRFLGIILRFPRLGVSTFIFDLQNAIFMNKLKVLSLIDCFVQILKPYTQRWKGFLLGFPPFPFIIIVSKGKRCTYI